MRNATPAGVDPGFEDRDVLGRDAECRLHGLGQRAVGHEDAAGIFGCLLRMFPRARLVGTGGQLGAPSRHDIRDAGFQRELCVPPEVRSVDYVRIERVDFAIEPLPPCLTVSAHLILTERLERLARSPLTGEAGGSEIQIGRGIAGSADQAADRERIVAP